MTAPLVAAEGLRRTRREGGARFTLRVPSLALRAAERVALVGPSGAGKSTLLLLLALALAPDAAARFEIGGEDAAALWRAGAEARLARLRARTVGIVPQAGGLIPSLPVGENILLTQALAGRHDERHARRLAEALGVASLWHRATGGLSAGQRQRIAIARALAHRPALILADEPTAAVHPALAEDILALLLREAEAAGAALVLATHDWDSVARLGLPRIVVTPDASGEGSEAAWA
ncbi:MAG: ATP-binding cassette domain-containing protein [Acetobacteraceae bacterium]|nr:ATP-binding cassette domain-containing protein [Acetobacteraceae bacterium]